MTPGVMPFSERLRTSTIALIRPVVLAGMANGLLCFAIDRSQPWSVASAGMGMALLGTVLSRQLGHILALEKTVGVRMRQLSVVSEVISALNSAAHVGAALEMTLDKLGGALEADAAAIWLPSTEAPGIFSLVEERGLPDLDRQHEILAQIQRAMGETQERFLHHTLVVPGREGDAKPAHAVTALLGARGENLGYLTFIRWSGTFEDTDAAILAAVGSDIGAALRSVRAITEARRLADKDPVTGLLNHRSAHQKLQAELQRHARADKPMAVVMMDLDNFKLFNDTYGHPAGDDVLRRVASVLHRTCRNTDAVARYGGDEFMVILPETNLKQAVRCAERIQASLAKERFRCEDSSSLPIGFSYGIAVCPDDSTEVLELVATADTNLYHSKTQGGNQIVARGTNRTDSSLIYVKGFDLFRAMVAAIDNKDGYTRKHSEEVTAYSVDIARAMKLGDDMVHTIQLAGILHDVGKIGVPDTILRKPGKLTEEEFAIMQQHPEFGALIVGAMPGMEHVVLGVRHHHERWDGRGYPDRLAGDNIPLIGRIMAVADAFSAMTTSRPYRKGLAEEQALDEIQRGLGTQFDPEIGALFIRLRTAGSAPPVEERPKRRRATRKTAEPAPLGIPDGEPAELPG